jgi:hypothetical protein
MHPRQTIRMYNHQKTWSDWWLVMIVGALLGIVNSSTLSFVAVKWSVLSAALVLIVVLGYVVNVVIHAMVLDVTAQIMGQKGQLMPLVYWIGLSQSVLWLLPIMGIIQRNFIVIGMILIIGLIGIHYRYMWIIMSQLYNTSTKMTWTLFGLSVLIILSGIKLMVSTLGYMLSWI